LLKLVSSRMLRVSILLLAEEDLVGIALYVSAESGARMASRVCTDLEKTFDLLAFMPGVGLRVEGAANNICSKVGLGTARSFLVYFRSDSEQVEILRVIHGRRDQE